MYSVTDISIQHQISNNSSRQPKIIRNRCGCFLVVQFPILFLMLFRKNGVKPKSWMENIPMIKCVDFALFFILKLFSFETENDFYDLGVFWRKPREEETG